MTLDPIMLRKYDTLFLDRDGVINVWRPNDYVKSWDEFCFNPGFLDFIGKYSGYFRHIFIVTNQRGVGKGVMTLQDLDRIHDLMIAGIIQAGGRIDRIFVCTSVNEDDPMRKPNTGMAMKAMKDFPDVTMEHSLMIGDQPSDLQFAQNCGMDFLLWS